MPNLDRRGFLGSLIGGVAATAAMRTFPFRVYSFPREIVLPGGGYLVPLEFARKIIAITNPGPVYGTSFVKTLYLAMDKAHHQGGDHFRELWLPELLLTAES